MKLKLFIIWSLLITICLVSNRLIAQTTSTNYFLPNLFPKSPTSAAFAKYGDYKVNLFTGVPDVSIPLYTIQSGGLEVPVTLSYHASGIKVSDVSSWVGLGWSVLAGGSITRSVNGLPDESGTGLLQSGEWHRNVDVHNTDADIDYAYNVIFGYADSQPDIFSYDFPGHSGKFFFEGSNGLKPALFPFAPISISHTTPTALNNYFMNFSVLDEHGNYFSFGKNNYQEATSTLASGSNKIATTAWMLDNIISQNRRDTISFSYTSQNMQYPDETSQVDVVEDNITGSGYSDKYTPHTNNSNSSSSVGEEDLNTILFKNGKVVFERDLSQNRKDQPNANVTYPLKDIQIMGYNYSTKTYQLQKKVIFYTSYFYPGVPTQTRLRLDSIQVQDAAGGIIQHYRFTYNSATTMPAYGSFAKDYWGYYNGKDNSTSLIPQFVFTASDNGGFYTYNIGSGNPALNNRATDSVAMKALILQSISYPTGGHTDFTYQANQYTDGSGNPALAGGLRIASIKSYDGINPTPIVKSYQYNIARANFMLDFSYFLTSQTHRFWTQTNQGGTQLCGMQGTERYTSIVSNPHTDPVPYDQALVVYPYVTEYIGTPGNNIGRTDYFYRDSSDNRQVSVAGTPIIQSHFYARGQLASKNEYLRKSDGTYQIVKKEINSYTAFPVKNHGTVGWAIDKTAWDDGVCNPPLAHYANDPNPNNTNQFLAQNYSIDSDDNYLTGTTVYNYDTNDPTKYTTSVTTYQYTDTLRQQVRSTRHMDSQGNTHVTYNKYPFDYLSGLTTHNLVVDSMLNHNIIAEVVEKWDSVKNVTTSLNAVTGGQFTQYDFGSLTGSLIPIKISILKTTPPLTNFVAATINTSTGVWQPDSRYVQMISFDHYDAKNNIAQYTPRNSTPVSILWDYQYGMPIAQVKNAANGAGGTQNIAYTSFEANGQGNWSFSGAPQPDATAPEGLNSYNLSSGTISSTILDNTRSYIVSYWSNNGAATINSTTGVPLRSYNGWTYYEHTIPSGTSTIGVSGTTNIDALRLYPVNAQMTTYTYDPTGLTAMADVRGQISHFEYDPFQRLKNIKDINGNIVNNYGYHTYDMTVTNDAIGATTFTRNNCPAGTSPTTTTYSVPAARYVSSTKASANAEATYDLNTNGQILANTVCGCPVTMVNVTLTNNSGLAGFQAHFTGPNTYNFNFLPSGSTTVQVAAGSTYTLQIPGISPFANHTFTLGTRTAVVAPSATWTSVNINTGS